MNALLGKSRPLGRTGFFCLFVFFISLGSAAHAADLEREFVWKSFGGIETLKVKVPAAMHAHYSAKARHFRYGSYLNEDAGYELTGKLAAAFERRAAEENLSEWEKINMVVDFVQSLQYQTETGEYPKYPIETLQDGGGDCEDTSILLAAILDKMGIDCVLLSPPGHMAVGLAITGLTGKNYLWAGKKYFYVETTGKDWEIGAIPTAYEGAAKIYQLPVSLTARRTVAAHILQFDPSEDETMIMLAFHRSPNGQKNPKTQETMYRYKVHLETDATTLADVMEVQYRRVETSEANLGKIPWMRAYESADNFSQEWTAADYVPVQVRIYFKDGSMVQTLIDFAPKISLD